MINYDLIKKYGGNMSIEDFQGRTRMQILKDAWEQSENIEEAEEFADSILEALEQLTKG